MSYLYRHALFVTRRQPYLDWANGMDDGGPRLDDHLSRSGRTVFLVPENEKPEMEALIEEFWEDIFEAELAGWMDAEDSWPRDRTREMFDEWFDVELNEAVYDLTPDEPLTQADVDAADLAEAFGYCAACGATVDEGTGRHVGFKLADRAQCAVFEGRVLPLPIGEDESVLAIVTRSDSDAARAGHDVIVRVCTSRCEKAVRKIVPKALRELTRRMAQET
jgi:hypothetical protein